ncbi:MAG: penicillin acylase family protein [Chloroherpetonaceae bacterium]|nr:penicillin acylase family protein [Chloroherpetonaceae bacterium]
MQRARKQLFNGITLTAVLLLISMTWFFIRIMKSSVHDYSSRFEINKGELESTVQITYDDFAVAHILADSEHDLFFSQGFTHARERLWQMESQRMASEGRLSEIYGEETVSLDKFFRTVGLRRIADSLWFSRSSPLKESTRRIIQAYCDGVNAYLQKIHSGEERLPLEFELLGYTPEYWRPQNTLEILRLMGWELNLSWHIDIVLAEIASKLGVKSAMLFYPEYEDYRNSILDSLQTAQVVSLFDSTNNKSKKRPAFQKSKVISQLIELKKIDTEFRLLFGSFGSHLGSNAWVVSPSKSKSGKAMLANDPHLGFTAPARWYEMHLYSPNSKINVAGFSLPGIPTIIFGKTPSIAWGMTNLMADDCDFFLHLDPSEFKNPLLTQEIVEEIKIKNAASISHRYFITSNGVTFRPERNSMNPTLQSPILDNYMISMLWTGSTLTDEIGSLYRIMKSSDWNDFKSALTTFGMPAQNFVYADSSGNIGYQAAGIIPIRTDQVGFRLRSATNPIDAWQGSIPFSNLPHIYNPNSGLIVTANQKPTKSNYPYYISSLWEPSSRAERIAELLNSQHDFSTEEFQNIQNDLISPSAKELIPYVLRAVESTLDPSTQTAFEYLKNWHFGFEQTSIAATIYAQFYRQLLINTFQDELGDELLSEYLALVNAPIRVIQRMMKDSTVTSIVIDSVAVDQVTFHPLFDNRQTAALETRDDIIRKSFSEAVLILKKNLGTDETEWRWGKIHKLTLPHLLGSSLRKKNSSKAPENIFNIGPFETGGHSTTINNGEYRFSEPLPIQNTLLSASQSLGASGRRVIDFSITDSYFSIIPGGNSGHPLSKYYRDQMPLWLQGKLKSVPTNPLLIFDTDYPSTFLIPKEE